MRKELLMIGGEKKAPQILKDIAHIRERTRIKTKKDDIEKIINSGKINLVIEYQRKKSKKMKKLIHHQSFGVDSSKTTTVESLETENIQKISDCNESPIDDLFERVQNECSESVQKYKKSSTSSEQNLGSNREVFDIHMKTNSFLTQNLELNGVNVDFNTKLQSSMSVNAISTQNPSKNQCIPQETTSPFIGDRITLLRGSEGEILERVECEILEYNGIKETQQKGSEIERHCPHYTVVLSTGNNKRVDNMLIDMFSARTRRTNISNILFYILIEEIENDLGHTNDGTKNLSSLHQQGHLKYQEINHNASQDLAKKKNIHYDALPNSLNESLPIYEISLRSIQDDQIVGYRIRFRIDRIWTCDEKSYKKSLEIRENKKQKNIEINKMGDRIGRIYTYKQDLGGIKIKKHHKIRDKFASYQRN